MASAQPTIDHDEIRRWADERGATPVRVKGTGDEDDPGIIRLDFPGYSGEGKLEPVTWEEWFEKFEEGQLALLIQGNDSNFNKLVKRENVEVR